MTTPDDVLAEARRWLGTREQPPGSNNVPGITDWYGLRGAWCAMFVSRVFFNVGMPLPASTSKGFAWVSAGFDWMKRQPGWRLFTDWREAQPGDIVAWEWGWTAGGFDHVSIVEAQHPFTTIGGNERDSVKREFFGVPGGAALFARPPYSIPDVPQEDDMSKPPFIQRTSNGHPHLIYPESGIRVDLATLDGKTGDEQVAGIVAFSAFTEPNPAQRIVERGRITDPALDYLVLRQYREVVDVESVQVIARLLIERVGNVPPGTVDVDKLAAEVVQGIREQWAK